MIKDTTVKVKISASNVARLRELGYEVEYVHPRYGTPTVIDMDVNHLLPGSNVRVNCICDSCGNDFTRKFCGNKSLCNRCTQSNNMKGNTLGKAHKGKVHACMQGENHPRWNPDKIDYEAYRAAVYRYTRLHKKSIHSGITLKRLDVVA